MFQPAPSNLPVRSADSGASGYSWRPPRMAPEAHVLRAKSKAGRSEILLRVDDELPKVAVGVPEVHARGGSPRAGDVAWRTDVIDSAIPQVLLGFLNRS